MVSYWRINNTRFRSCILRKSPHVDSRNNINGNRILRDDLLRIKYTQIGQENEKERTNTAMGLCTVCAIITILVCVLAVPGINEEVKEGGIVVPTYSATVIVTVDPDQILVGKDFTLYQDNKKIDSFHLRAWEQWQKTIEVKWTMDPIGETTFKVTSSGAEGLGDGTDSKTIRMTDGQIYRITLRA